MCRRLMSAAFACSVLCFAAPVLAQPVLITAGTKVLSVSSSGAQMVRDIGSSLGDLTVGPDNRIYVAVIGSGRIDRMNNDTAGTQHEVIASGLSLARHSGIRFDSLGNLYIVDVAGNVLRIAEVASADSAPYPAPAVVLPGLSGGSAGGVAFTHDGGLLVLDPQNGSVRRAARNPQAAAGFDPPNDSFTTGLPANAVGLVVASGGENTQADHTTGQILVAAGHRILRCPKTGGSVCTEWATLGGAANLAQHVELFSDDTMLAVTAVVPDGVRLDTLPDNNGRLWKVTGAGVVQQLTSATLTSATCTQVRIKGTNFFECQPFIGVGVPATSRSIQTTFAPVGLFHEAVYHFGSHIFDAASDAAPTCPVRVTAGQTPVAAVRTALEASFGAAHPYRLMPYLGEEGWVSIYQTELVAPEGIEECSHDAAASSLIVAALFGEFLNPRIIACTDSMSGCEELDVFGVWSKGPIDDDQASGGRLDRGFGTKFFVVDRALAPSPSLFCGFDAPLKADGSASVTNNQTIAVKFSAKTGNCSNGTFDATLRPIISLLRLEDANGTPLNEIIRVPSSSGSSNEPPEFRLVLSKKPADNKYIFDLSLKDLAKGLYEIGVTDQNSRIEFATVKFRIP